MRNGRPLHMPAPGERGSRSIPLKDWVKGSDAEMAARRHQVFGLLGWYHRTQVLPWRGVRGWLRRYWYILTGRRLQTLSIWEQMELRALAGQLAQEAAERVAAAEQAPEHPEPA